MKSSRNIRNKTFKKLQTIGNFLTKGENWFYVICVIGFTYLTSMLFWFQIHSGVEIDYLDNLIRPSILFRVFICLPFLLWLLSPLWIKEDVNLYLKKTAKYFAWLIPLQLLVFYLPILNIYISNLFSFLQLFVLGLSITLWLYLTIIEPLIISKTYKKINKINWTKFLPWGLFSSGLLIYCFYTIFVYNNFSYPLKDLTVFDQAIWNLSHFRLPESTVRGLSNLWGDHFHPILIFFAPLYWIKSDVRILLLAQAIILSLGVFPIYWIAKKKLKSDYLAFAFSFSWLFFLGIQNAIAFGFYPETIAITLLVYAVWFIIENKYWQFLLFTTLALMCKENISLYILALSVYFIFFEKKKIGWFSGILSIIWFIVAPKIIVHIGGSYIYFYYGQLGSNFLEVISTILTNPLYSLKILFNPIDKIYTMMYLFIPMAFLPILSPFFIVLLPNLAEKFLSSNQLLWGLGFHYGAGISTFLIVAAVYGLKTVINKNYFPKILINKITFFGTLIIILNIMIFINVKSPLLAFRQKSFYKLSLDQNMTNQYKLIPKDASLSAQNSIGVPLGHRKNIYLWDGFSYHHKTGDYILLSNKYSIYPLSREQYRSAIYEALNTHNYGIYYSNNEVLILKKGETSKNISTFWQDYLDK